ncbi:MAG: DUF3465 domain-containing protein [Desulfobacterium sp.]|jgi:hypothetical protein|nr:DUF3465 domain-containing protein [Desulfobacterium sp.]
MKKIFIVVLIAIGIYGYIQTNQDVISVFTGENIQRGNSVADAYQNQLSNVQVSGSGSVSHILSDDNKGSRHQRFVIGLSSGQTLLVAHNIDLAPKIKTLKKGDKVEFFGEYKWNSKGGIVHWTHHDPGGRHIGGWLKHNGCKYE